MNRPIFADLLVLARAKRVCCSLLFMCLALPAAATEVPFSDSRWQFTGDSAEVVTVDGREALHLRNGRAVLPDAAFVEGIIEFDVMVTPERGFHGIHFRMQDENNGENFYIRPHQSGNADANQYTPIFNGLPGWQLYYGPQFSAPTRYRFGEWMTVRVVVAETGADVYVGDMDEPALHISQLKNRHVVGPLALSSAYAPAYFAGFRFMPSDSPALVGTGAPMPVPPSGIVSTWSVSSPFDGKTLAGVTELGAEHRRGLRWEDLEVEDRGYANLARITVLAADADTVFARVRLSADEAETKLLRFGYSDRVRVYLNGTLLYAGDNGNMTRDYRYLGTIGLFDAIPIPLKAGENELALAVSESFGGWGVMAEVVSIDDRNQ